MPHTMQLIHITRLSIEWHDRFYRHVRDVFPGADFETWANAGFWTNRYDVLALVSDGEIIATAGRTLMLLSQAGMGHGEGFRTLREGMQLGAVGVKAEFRGEGIGRHLMTIVLREAERMQRPVLLFANRAARGFYSSLGFVALESDQVVGHFRISPSAVPARRLSPHSEEDRRKISDAVVSGSSHRGGLAARTDLSILLWHLFNTPVRALEVCEGRSIAFVEDEPDGTLAIREWLGERPRDIAPLLPHLTERPVSRIVFGFVPPESWFDAGLALVRDPDSHMFLRGLSIPVRPICFPHLLRT